MKGHTDVKYFSQTFGFFVNMFHVVPNNKLVCDSVIKKTNLFIKAYFLKNWYHSAKKSCQSPACLLFLWLS